MNRRIFLAVMGRTASASRSVPILDTHIHLFDPSRPAGVPWPPKTASFYRPTLPRHFRQVATPCGVTGAIVVECSPWVEDNQWVLDVAAEDPIIVGVVGNLEPDKPEFPYLLERFSKNKLFCGIRYGYLWGRNLRAELARPAFSAGLKLLAETGLTLDTANPSLPLLEDVVRITDLVPGLRVVVDHLAGMALPGEPAQRAAYRSLMRELGTRPQVYAKVSGILRLGTGSGPQNPSFYREKLDELWETFGSDRLLYGSDWPNSEPLGTYAQTLDAPQRFFRTKGREAEEKCFWRNPQIAYRRSLRRHRKLLP